MKTLLILVCTTPRCNVNGQTQSNKGSREKRWLIETDFVSEQTFSDSVLPFKGCNYLFDLL